MTESETLAKRFEAHRARLSAMALRMLGSRGEADDAVQEAWLRLDRASPEGVDNLGAWLTTVVARICLDVLRARRSHSEEPLSVEAPDGSVDVEPDAELRLADSVGLALLVVLETLAPAERLAFVLHDMFDVPFDEIAPIVRRSPEATRQLASRARRYVRGAAATAEADRASRRRIVEAFLAASRDGNFDALLETLAPDVVLRADRAAVDAAAARAASGAPALAPEIRGARAVAEGFRGRARAAQLALVDGAPGAVWAPTGAPAAVFAFTFAGEAIVAIDVVMDAERLRRLEIAVLEGSAST